MAASEIILPVQVCVVCSAMLRREVGLQVRGSSGEGAADNLLDRARVQVDARSELSHFLFEDLDDIFDDMTNKALRLGLKGALNSLTGRTIRIATLCSGTESPLLAMEMVADALKTRGLIGFDVEHVFSAEIVPHKQAYIERNFAPPLLFRDVCELGDDQAHTAYGALVDVPGDVDLLVAGTR